MEQYEKYIKRCLHLAKLGEGAVSPNPMVGAVLVSDDVIIGEGYHKKWGGVHAEVDCLDAVPPGQKHLIPKSTLYVSLEPCSHFGKTPPCADLIIQHGIPRVVVGCVDPFAEVAGNGIRKLRSAGIDVTVGVLEKECRMLNKRFVTFQEQRRPYITLKWAQSADHKITGGHFKRVFISNACSNRLVHQWRSQEAAILVGTNTALFDDPELTTRLWPGNNPVRLVLDKNLRLPASLKLFDGTQQTIVFNNILQSKHPNLMYHRLSGEESFIKQILKVLHELRLQSLMVEGGTQLLQTFINEGWWDEAKVITNQHLVLNNGLQAPQLQQHRLLHTHQLSGDVIHSYAHENNLLMS